LAKTQPAAEAPTLRPGEAPSVRGPGRRPGEAPEAAARQPEVPPKRTLRGMAPEEPILPPKLVRRIDNPEAVLSEYITHQGPGKTYNISSPTSLRQEWKAMGGTGEPPPGWIDSNNRLWVDGEKVLGWWGGTPPARPVPAGPGPIFSRKTVPYAESPVLNRPGANVPPELVKTLPPETMHGMGPPGPTLPPGSMPPGTRTLPPGGRTQPGLGPGPTLPPGAMPPGTRTLPPGGRTQPGLGPGPTLPPGTVPPGTPTAPYPKITLGPEPPSGLPITGGRTQPGLGPGPTLPPGTVPPGTPTAPYPKITLGPEPPTGLPITGGRTQPGLGPGPTLPPGSMPPGTRTLPPGGRTQPGLGPGPTLPPIPVSAAAHPTVLYEVVEPTAAFQFAERWIVDLGREPRYWMNRAQLREHWRDVMLRPGEPPPVYVSSDNVLHIDTTRIDVPDTWYIRGLPGGVPFNRPPGPGGTLPPTTGGGSILPGEPAGTKTIPDITSPTLPGARFAKPVTTTQVGPPRTPARFQKETRGHPTPTTKALAMERSREDIRTPETACVVPSRLQPLQANAESIFNHLGGERTEYAIVACDDATILSSETGRANIGALARQQLGAFTDPTLKIIWVNGDALSHGVLRPWGATLNPRQVIAHEIGHAITGSKDCAAASQAGAKLSGLSDTEKEGLLLDAMMIKGGEVLAARRKKGGK